jgi:hypothetical protein
MVLLEAPEENIEGRINIEELVKPTLFKDKVEQAKNQGNFCRLMLGLSGTSKISENQFSQAFEGITGNIVILSDRAMIGIVEGKFEHVQAYFEAVSKSSVKVLLFSDGLPRAEFTEYNVATAASFGGLGYNGETSITDVAKLFKSIQSGLKKNSDDLPNAELLDRLVSDWGMDSEEWRMAFTEEIVEDQPWMIPGKLLN